MKEIIYENIFSYCEKKHPENPKVKKVSRVALVVSYVYYLLMCFAYLFAMILAIGSDDVNFVDAGRAKNLLAIMIAFIIAESLAVILAYKGKPLVATILSAVSLVISPYALWNDSINFKFEVNHLIAMALLFAVILVMFIADNKRNKALKKLYNKTVATALENHRTDNELMTKEKIDEILQNYDPEAIDTTKPLKRSKKDKIRKNK